MKKIALLCLILAGCELTPVRHDTNNEHINIFYPMENRTRQAVLDHCGPKALACVQYSTDDKSTAAMYAVEPRGMEDWQGFCILGHELYHLIRGSFHGKNESTCQ